MVRLLGRFARDEGGTTAVEYGLIAALIVLAILAALAAFGDASSNLIARAMTALGDAIGG